MRKVFSLILLSAFLFNISGYYLAYILIRQTIRNEMRSSLRQNDHGGAYIVMSFTKEQMTDNNNFRWIKDDEFRYQGKMYDVKRTEEKNGTKVFYCINDSREEDLIAAFKDRSDACSGNPRKAGNNASLLLRLIIKEAPASTTFTFLIPQISGKYNLPAENFYISAIRMPTFHPPEFS